MFMCVCMLACLLILCTPGGRPHLYRLGLKRAGGDSGTQRQIERCRFKSWSGSFPEYDPEPGRSLPWCLTFLHPKGCCKDWKYVWALSREKILINGSDVRTAPHQVFPLSGLTASIIQPTQIHIPVWRGQLELHSQAGRLSWLKKKKKKNKELDQYRKGKSRGKQAALLFHAYWPCRAQHRAWHS